MNGCFHILFHFRLRLRDWQYVSKVSKLWKLIIWCMINTHLVSGVLISHPSFNNLLDHMVYDIRLILILCLTVCKCIFHMAVLLNNRSIFSSQQMDTKSTGHPLTVEGQLLI